ncbi:MAG TPA: branched-chain-amino-acid transaminase [Gemmatimonadales bacterium]|nr:branched-chain-amino-acid transaminase [Gemmatimonadales bacterium]
MTTIWLDGEWHDRETAKVSVFDHGLLYGDGVFEGIRVYGGKIFRLSEHLDRLYDSARAIALTIPLSKAEFAAVVEEGVRRSGLQEAYLRPVVTRGVGDLGIDPRKCPMPTVIVIIDSIRVWPAEVYERGLRLMTAGTPIPHKEALSPRVKSLNYLAHVMAKLEASNAGVDDVLMMDSAGMVAEGSGQNLFVVRDGIVKTPPVWAGILKGVTRDAVMELAAEMGHPVQEVPLNRYDVYTADEAFFTGTASELVGIRELDGRPIGSGKTGPLTLEFMKRFRELVRR